MNKDFFLVTKDPLSVETALHQIIDPKNGAVDIFVGTVREWTGEKQTTYLEYEAYEEMAVKMLKRIGEEIEEKWPISNVAIHHRIGKLEISDIAVIIAVTAPHRKDVFDATKYGIERIKQIVPIWKKEVWSDGEVWIGSQISK